jgi:hypothetical protein
MEAGEAGCIPWTESLLGSHVTIDDAWVAERLDAFQFRPQAVKGNVSSFRAGR